MHRLRDKLHQIGEEGCIAACEPEAVTRLAAKGLFASGYQEDTWLGLGLGFGLGLGLAPGAHLR